jgi:hypothetical protein
VYFFNGMMTASLNAFAASSETLLLEWQWPPPVFVWGNRIAGVAQIQQ